MSNKYNIYVMLFAIYSFIISFYFFPYYTKGDQADYNEFYNNVAFYNLQDAYIYYNSRLGAGEPIYFIMIFLISPLINKNILFSILNMMLGYFLSKNLLKSKMHPVLLPLVGFNYYLLVLFLAADRLKLSMLFFVISLSVASRLNKFTFISLSFFSHFQSIFIIQAKYASQIKKSLIRLKKLQLSKELVRILFLCFLLGLSIYFFKDSIERKTEGYMNSNMGEIKNILKPSFFYLLSLLYAQKAKISRFEVSLMQIPIIAGALLFGDTRLTLLAFSIFIYIGIKYNRGLNIGVVGALIYFSIQCYILLDNIIIYGHGFPSH